MRYYLFLTILLLPTFAFAADWVLLGNTRAGDTFYVDKSSVKKSDKMRTVEEKQVFRFSQISKNGSIYNEAVLVKSYDCEKKAFTLIEVTGKDSKGNTVFNERFENYYKQNPEKKWTRLSAGSLFVKSYDIACR